MDPSITLKDTLSHLTHLITTTPSLTSSHHPVLPPTISPLPSRSSTLPSSPSSISTLLSHLQTYILPNLSLSSLSPNYYGFVTGGATPAALLADWVTSIYDQNVSVHLPRDSIATNVEVAALNLLVELFDLPKAEWGVAGQGRGGGTFTTGATASNVLGLALGREWVLKKAVERKIGGGNGKGQGLGCGDTGVYEMMKAGGIEKIQVLSSMPHSSIGKAASVVGIGRTNVVSIARPSGDPLDIDLEMLRKETSRENVASILAVSAGEVNTGRYATGSLETFQEIRRICDENDVWMHVDGAFGLFGRVLMGCQDEGQYKAIIDGVRGIELADSITGDGHKLLNVPYDCGFFFTRHKQLSEAVFQNGNAAYLTSGTAGGPSDGIQGPLNIGIENSRRFRALPVYATLITYGRQGYVDMLERQIALARSVASWILDHPDDFELLPNSDSQSAIDRTFMIVLFRAVNKTLNASLVKKINETGEIYVTGTSWDGQPAARIAVSNWRVDVERDSKIIKKVLSGVLNDFKNSTA